MLITQMALKVFIDNPSCFCHSFHSKESLWKDAVHVAKSVFLFLFLIGMLESGMSAYICNKQKDSVVCQNRLLGCGCIAVRQLELFL